MNTARRNSSSSSMKPPSSGFKSWPSCTPYIQNLPASGLQGRGTRSHLAGVSLQNMQVYLLHHLKSVDVKQNLFSD
ncbi:hypothetical protein DFAR_3460004 [Desulfarculales bacterium]